jgi:hypothetical protein
MRLGAVIQRRIRALMHMRVIAAPEIGGKPVFRRADAGLALISPSRPVAGRQ